MKILHTADLHIGQILYQNYDRKDEHDCFFSQLRQWCLEEQPDALIASGDIFDIANPSATVWKFFTEKFVELHDAAPGMKIVITAGNHDSPSRLAAHRDIWRVANTVIAGHEPLIDPANAPDGWEDNFIVELPTGFIAALPYMHGERREATQHLLDTIASRNAAGLPVVATGHMTVAGCDMTGHDLTIGTLQACGIESTGTGYDYLALGHIHRPQTLNHEQDRMKPAVSYPSPVARYSGSALHVSCDEAYPHSVSLVEIDRHNGTVAIKQLPIRQLRHFITIPAPGESPLADAADAMDRLIKFINEGGEGYIRFAFDNSVSLPSDFSSRVYDLIESRGKDVRYNPKILWTGDTAEEVTQRQPAFEVAELQQMTNPLEFVKRVIGQFDGLSLGDISKAFAEVEKELKQP